jgi:fumarate hydratase class II
MADDTRIEHDSMGDVEVPSDAYYGASTKRAMDNFAISGIRLPRRFLHALGRIKAGAARANAELGLLPGDIATAIHGAAVEVADGAFDEQFVVDVFQTGSGTSTNMNANEVIANRAAERLGARRGARDRVHPNDHVNLGQSSNDVIPTALHVSVVLALREDLDPSLGRLAERLEAKARELWGDVKTGRTHLQDATPIRIGQVFRGYASQIARCRQRLAAAADDLREVALGGTAVGTGLNTHPRFAALALADVSKALGFEFRESDDHVRSQSSIDDVVAASGALRTTAIAITKVANDIRFLASGPRCGLGEIAIPAVQPGSSIMPGKINPVIAESTVQACAQVLANDAAVVHCGLGGQFELNTMLPLAAHVTLQSIALLARAADNFGERCVAGVRATGAAAAAVERGLGLATALVPLVGYDRAAEIAKVAAATGATIREVAVRETELDEATLDAALDPIRMTGPGT